MTQTFNFFYRILFPKVFCPWPLQQLKKHILRTKYNQIPHCACIVSLLCGSHKGEQKLDAELPSEHLRRSRSLLRRGRLRTAQRNISQRECEKALLTYRSVKLRSIMVLMKSSYRVLVIALCSSNTPFISYILAEM